MTTTDIDATVAEIEARYEHAYSAANASELARLFAEDAMVQTEWGPVLDGRERIVQGLVALFRSPGGPGALRNVPVLSRRAAANVIVSHGIASRTPTGGTEETFLYTRVYVQRDGTWLLLANQIARPSNHPRPLGIGR
ncbi:MAG: SgcJ/EcaC family oxidoreductase [Polyangiaceae bacterium]|jgi:uncharacterized protein (TIGR02246 family)